MNEQLFLNQQLQQAILPNPQASKALRQQQPSQAQFHSNCNYIPLSLPPFIYCKIYMGMIIYKDNG
jgi:hypothetical protein